MVATLKRAKRKVIAKPQPVYMVGDVEVVGDDALLELTIDRHINGEYTSGDEFWDFLNNISVKII